MVIGFVVPIYSHYTKWLLLVQNLLNYLNLYSSAEHSLFKYYFEQNKIKDFNNFRNNITNKVGYNNKFYKFAINHFMSGANKCFFYKIYKLERIVDYIIALESLFLIDNKNYFLRRTIAKRISRFLNDDSIKETVKFMYDERSNIVHGNYIDLLINEQSGKVEKIKTYMQGFEVLIRKVFIRLFDFNFSKKKEIVSYMEKLYDIPNECLKIMKSAQEEANKCIKNLRKN